MIYLVTELAEYENVLGRKGVIQHVSAVENQVVHHDCHHRRGKTETERATLYGQKKEDTEYEVKYAFEEQCLLTRDWIGVVGKQIILYGRTLNYYTLSHLDERHRGICSLTLRVNDSYGAPVSDFFPPE